MAIAELKVTGAFGRLWVACQATAGAEPELPPDLKSTHNAGTAATKSGTRQQKAKVSPGVIFEICNGMAHCVSIATVLLFTREEANWIVEGGDEVNEEIRDLARAVHSNAPALFIKSRSNQAPSDTLVLLLRASPLLLRIRTYYPQMIHQLVCLYCRARVC